MPWNARYPMFHGRPHGAHLAGSTNSDVVTAGFGTTSRSEPRGQASDRLASLPENWLANETCPKYIVHCPGVNSGRATSIDGLPPVAGRELPHSRTSGRVDNPKPLGSRNPSWVRRGVEALAPHDEVTGARG